MKTSPSAFLRVVSIALVMNHIAADNAVAAAAPVIVTAPDAPPLVQFAAREVGRYIYLRTGTVPELLSTASTPPDHAIVITSRDHPLSRLGHPKNATELPELSPESYQLRTDDQHRTWIVGGSPQGALYGAYRYAEHLGVRFYLHGDVIPDDRLAGALPAVNETRSPLFTVRGLQPFHDFAEGPDWWNQDDYRAVIGQMAKLQMNFLGLHTYPESTVGPEPTVWIGLPGEADEQGRVHEAYPASLHTTGRSGKPWWGYEAMPTRDFTGGAADLFERDDFGGEVMRDHPYAAQTPDSATVVFNRTADLLRDAFTEAHRFGIQTCVGTETPLVLPAAVQARIDASGRSPDLPVTAEAVYFAMFQRIARAYPIDTYWLWTPENWTWEGNKPDQFAATAADIEAALRALERLGNPFKLATCGWVLGPQHDRAALDKLLPPESPMSCINQSVGHQAIERQFANLSARPRWAIPWLENDGALIQPQLWAGRMRFDAADARRLGCDGLLGIHWRTRVIAPNVSALAGAMWDQSWIPPTFDSSRLPPQTSSGAIGGRPMAIPSSTQELDENAVFASARVGMQAYEIPVPNGVYTLTLSFHEPAGASRSERVFSVRLDGRPILENLDLTTTPDPTFTHIVRDHRITTSSVRIDFDAIQGEPAISGITIEGTTDVNSAPYRRLINCGGPALKDFEADVLPGAARPDAARTMPVEAFYRDFAEAHFGAETGPAIGAILARMDGKLHQTTGWLDGPGGITRHVEPWSTFAPQYAFIDELERLRPEIRGAGNMARFDAWLAQFHVFRAIAQIGCSAGAFDLAVQRASALTDAGAAREVALSDLLPQRLALARAWEQLIALQITASDTLGELGILANLEQHNRLQQRFLTRHDDALTRMLGTPLPPDAQPGQSYHGPARIIVPTLRTSAHAGEPVSIRVILVGAKTPKNAALLWRPMGSGERQRIPLELVGRRVYQAALPPMSATLPALEYWIEADLDEKAPTRWPADEGQAGHTIVLLDTNVAASSR